MSSDNTPLEFILEPGNTGYDDSDGRWIEQVNQFLGDIQDSGLGSIHKETKPESGSKGGPEAIILALGSAGAITAAVDIFRAWLGRDRNRNLKIKFKRGDVTEEIAVEGTGMNADTIKAFMEMAVKKAAGGS